jgi:alkanesulfonate monooxygenase SsuD/methylene tetrahydromethanopterin reductase-like flavin-dependent oxidoreductase (luciferase family)
MPERLGLGIIPGAGWRASEIRAIAREAEDAGFDAIVTTEVSNFPTSSKAGIRDKATDSGPGPPLP